MGTPAKQIIYIKWSPNFAYAIGLIASDGWLSKGTYRIGFGSKELEMMTNFILALGLKNKLGRHARGGEKDKRYFYINFKSKLFYNFLLTIGLTPTKSHTIGPLAIPDQFFGDFLRGLFDGDGTFYSFKDPRWPNSFLYKTSFASASKYFLTWLKKKTTKLYDVKGYLHQGAGVMNLEYTKRDSAKLFEAMYRREDILFLSRKYRKMKTALEHDLRRSSLMVKHSPEERMKSVRF